MKKTLFLYVLITLLWTASSLGQTTKLVWPYDINGSAPTSVRTTLIEVDSNATGTFSFKFGDGASDQQEHYYSGFVSIVAWIDTSLTDPAGTKDSLNVDLFALFYDQVTRDYERSQNGAATSDDSLRLVTAFSWGNNNSTTYTFSKVINFMPCDGFLIKATNTDSPFRIRFELRVAKYENN